MTDTNQSQSSEASRESFPGNEGASPLISPIPREKAPPRGLEHEQSAAVVFKAIEYRLKFTEETHQYVREYIRLADQKAGFFFAATTALLAFLYKEGLARTWLVPISSWHIPELTSFITTAALAIASVLFLWAIFPRIRGSRRGLIFFSAIAECGSADGYLNEVSARSTEELIAAKLEHIYELATVCQRKYQILRLALLCGLAGLIGSIVSWLCT